MRAPVKPKPQASEEVARVLRIHDALEEELRARYEPMDSFEVSELAAILQVADRIASRTEG